MGVEAIEGGGGMSTDDDRERQAEAEIDDAQFDRWLSDSFGLPISEPISEPERGDDGDALIDLHAGARQPATDGDAQLDAWIDGAFGLKP